MSRVLGLDVGDKRIGVALSDEGRLIASPLTVIQSVGWGPRRCSASCRCSSIRAFQWPVWTSA